MTNKRKAPGQEPGVGQGDVYVTITTVNYSRFAAIAEVLQVRLGVVTIVKN